MQNKISTETQFIIPTLIVNGAAFELISSIKHLRKELYKVCRQYLTISYKENTYLKYFLYPSHPKKGGIPHNQNFTIVCGVMEFALIELLMSILYSSKLEKNVSLNRSENLRMNNTQMYDTINCILKPYIQNIKKNETAKKAICI